MREPFLRRATKLGFYNTSTLDMATLLGDQDNLRANLESYIQGFSPDVRSIFDNFDFAATIDGLHKAKLLYLVVEKFAGIELHPSKVDNIKMGPKLIVSFLITAAIAVIVGLFGISKLTGVYRA